MPIDNRDSAPAPRGPAPLNILATATLAIFLTATATVGQSTVRARDLGIPFEGTPGPLNAITDVRGVEVGHATIVRGIGPLVRGSGPVRTGVTAVLPRGNRDFEAVFAGWYSLNGNGEMTGTSWIAESGMLEGPVLITNTHSVGVVRDATIAWLLENQAEFAWALPVVAETYDGRLNDINGFHVKPEHVFAALDEADGGPVEEGGVGGGTGMVCHGFKGGIGTASRVLPADQGGYTVGVLVQCNYGSQRDLRLGGVPVGREISRPGTCRDAAVTPARAFALRYPVCGDEESGRDSSGDAQGNASHPNRGEVAAGPTREDEEAGSIIVVVATDAPLLPQQLDRLTRRVPLALGRQGSIASNFSGDLFVAFSVGNPTTPAADGLVPVRMLPNDEMDPLLRATIRATEEAISNALVAAETMTGADGIRVRELPHDRVRELLAQYNRVAADAR